MSATHARRGHLAAFAALIRFDASRPAAPRATIGMRAADIPAPATRPAAPETTMMPAPEPAPGPVHMCPPEGGVMPCCELTPFEVPRSDRVTIRPELVTCAHGIATPETLAAIIAEAEAEAARNGTPAETEPWGPPWDLPDGLLTDSRDDWFAPPARPYVPEPEPSAPDLCADLADLAIFREALAMRTRCHAEECLCGHRVAGETWAERMIRAGIHVLASEGATA